MATQDYNSLTVVQIRELFKERGIPAKGLTRKQQLIDRLLELDAERDADKDAPPPPPAKQDAPPQAAQSEPTDDAPAAAPQASQLDVSVEEQRETADEPVVENAVPNSAPEAQPAEQAAEATSDDTGIGKQPPPAPAADASKAKAGSPFEPSKVTAPITEELQHPSNNLASTSVSVSPAHTSTDATPAAEESRKRKRRSATPSVDPEEIAKKRARQTEEGITQKAATEQRTQHDLTDAITKDPVEEETTAPEEAAGASDDKPEEHSEAPPASADAVETTSQPALDEAQSTAEPEKEILAEPASLHPQSRALYIRNLKRPVRAEALERHLQTLAQLPTNTALPTFYINRTRSHAFAIFPSTDNAVRARAKLHGVVWPNEPQREELWVDFVPPQDIDSWIADEDAGSATTRWEVTYDGESEDVRVVHRIAPAPIQPPRGPSGFDHGPSREREREAERERDRHSRPAEKPAASFLKLDELFKSTTTKPKLYFQPVSRDIANRRLDELDRLTARRIEGGSGLPDSRRYTFDDGDMLADDGPEYGLRGGPGGGRGGGRGRGGGGRGFGGRGGYRPPPREGMRAWR